MFNPGDSIYVLWRAGGKIKVVPCTITAMTYYIDRWEATYRANSGRVCHRFLEEDVGERIFATEKEAENAITI